MLFALFACTGTPADSSIDAVDLRLEYEETPGATLVYEPPDIVVPAYTDQQFCWFTSYDGPDVGVTGGTFYQNPDFGHHVIVMRTNADPELYPDGSVHDCTETDDVPMTDMEPFVLPTDLEEGKSILKLPDGMANKMKGGERLLVQSHHINYTDQDILVNDRIDLVTTDLENVEVFAAPFAHTQTDLEIPIGEYTETVTCEFQQDYDLLYLLGHMHEWGQYFRIDHNKADGSVETLYEIDSYDPLFRDNPPITRYEDGFPVKKGESFTTTCVWDNDTDDVLTFPYEMCVTTGMIYPATVPDLCEPD